MKKLIFLLAVIFSAECALSQTVEYSNTLCFSGSSNNLEYATVVAKAQDGGYYIGTNEGSIGFIYKYDISNSLSWIYEWNNGSINHGITHIVEGSDGLYVVGIELMTSDINGFADQLVVKKISLNGDSVLWQAVVGNGDESNQGAWSVVLENDNTLLIGSSSSDDTGLFSQTHGYFEGLVMVISAEDGYLIESRTLGGSMSDRITGFFESADGYIAVGSTNSNDYDFAGMQGDKLFVTFLNGNLQTGNMSLSSITEGYVKKTIQVKHERVLYASVGMKNTLGYIVVADAGGIVWERSFGTEAHLFQDIIATDDGGFIAVGYTFDIFDSYENKTGLMVKFSATGDMVWNQYFGAGHTGEHTEVKSIVELFPGEYLVGGTTTMTLFECDSVVSYDGWVVRLTETPQVVTGIQNTVLQEIAVFPNPVIDGAITISSSKNSHIRIHDLYNPERVVFERDVEKGETLVHIEASPGMYLLTDGSSCSKIILQ